MTSFETDPIPDFLLDRVQTLEEGALRSVAEYARNPFGAPPDDVPENIAEPLYLQDEETCEAVAEYAEGLAEEGEATEASGEEDDEDDDDDDDDRSDFMMGPAFG